MKLVMPKVAGRSDGKRVNELAKGLLAIEREKVACGPRSGSTQATDQNGN